MRIPKLPAKILYYVSDEFDKIYKNVSLYVSIQNAERISTSKLELVIVHSYDCDIFVNLVLLGNIERHVATILLFRLIDFQT